MPSPASRQEQHQPREIFRPPNPPRRLATQQAAHGGLEPERGHPAGEDAGADAVYIDVQGRELGGQDAREVDCRGLGGAVGEGAVAHGGETARCGGGDIRGGDTGHAGDVDDPAGVVRGGGAEEQGFQADGGVEQGFHVQRHELVPPALREGGVGRAPGGAAVVDEHGQPVRLGGHRGDEGVDPGFVFEVGDDVRAVAGAERVEARAGLDEFGLFARGDDDAGAVLDVGLRCHFAQAGLPEEKKGVSGMEGWVERMLRQRARVGSSHGRKDDLLHHR